MYYTYVRICSTQFSYVLLLQYLIGIVVFPIVVGVSGLHIDFDSVLRLVWRGPGHCSTPATAAATERYDHQNQQHF